MMRLILTTVLILTSYYISGAQSRNTISKIYIDSIDGFNSRSNEFIKNVSHLDSVKFLSNKAIQYSKKEGYDKGEIIALTNLASAHYYEGKIDSAIYFTNNALSISKKHKLDSLTSIVSNTLGVFYRHSGQFGMAMEAHYTSLSIEEKSLNQHGLWRVLVNLTALYDQIGDYQKSLKFGLKSIVAADTIKSRLMRSFVNVGIAYLNLKQYSNSTSYTKKALTLSENLGNTSIKLTCIINLAEAYFQMNQIDSARTFSKLAYNLSETSNKNSRIFSLINSSLIFLHDKKYDSAIMLLTKAKSLVLETKDKNSFVNILTNLSKAYSGKLNFKLAYQYADSARLLTAELKNEDVIKAINNSISSYEVVKKENEVQRIEAEKRITEIELAAQKKVIFNLIVFSIVVVLAILVLLYLLKRIKKADKVIRETNEMLQTKNEIIEMANAELTEKTMRNQLNPHFIFNCLNTLHYLLLKNNSEDAQLYLSKFSYLLRRILESTDRPSVSVAEEIEIIQIYVKLESLRFDDSINLLIDTESFDPEDVYIPPLLTQSILENAIPHGLSPKIGEKNIFIRFTLENNNLKCSITDNGVGRGQKKADTFGSKRDSKGVKLTATRLASFNQHIKEHAIVTTDLLDENNKPCGTRVELELTV